MEVDLAHGVVERAEREGSGVGIVGLADEPRNSADHLIDRLEALTFNGRSDDYRVGHRGPPRGWVGSRGPGRVDQVGG